METVGVVPLLYLRQSERIDGAGRGEVRFTAYNGLEHSFRWPQILDDQMPGGNAPLTIIPGLRVRGSCEAVRFRFQETSPPSIGPSRCFTRR
jgi:hypothetical protein